MARQAKRPYAGSQPSITSYFPSTSVPPPNGHYNISPNPSPLPQSESCFPTLPTAVQSNLLSVGMRVRKSVPEGYKTNTFSGFALFAENTETPAQTLPQKTSPKTRPRAGARELTPFCGILKVGGLAQQAWGIYNPTGGHQLHDQTTYTDQEMDEDEDEPPFLSSQASTISTTTVTNPSRENKRRFFDEEEEDSLDERKSYAKQGLPERSYAVPRRRAWAGKGFVRAGQENITVVGQDVDFEDAEFLDYGLVGEVEMSG